MLGPAHEIYVQADLAYRREQLQRTSVNRVVGRGWSHRLRDAWRNRRASVPQQTTSRRATGAAQRTATEPCPSRN